VDLADRVVDIDERHPLRGIGTGDQTSGPGGQSRQEPATDRVKLLDMAVGERPQERAQRRRRTHPAEQPRHPTMAQQIEVIDAVGAGQHATHHAGRLRRSVGRGDAQLLIEKVMQTSRLRQPQDRDQTRDRHQVRIIEHRPDRVRRFHLRGCSLDRAEVDVAIDILPAQEGFLVLRHAHPADRHRWIRA
jgi:hypothetical protein